MTQVQNLRVQAIQTFLFWESPKENLDHLGNILKTIKPGEADLIVLPEMFSTGFTMNAREVADTPKGETLVWMRIHARQMDAAITGSVIVREQERFYNRMYFVWPNGHFETYDKRHTFSYAGEDKVFTAGSERLIVEYKGWRICPLICYDLRFPVWSRNTENYDLLIYVANWPTSRIAAWDALLTARAIENMCFVVGVNRVGKDGNEIDYTGHSAIYHPLGGRMGFQGKGKPGQIVAELGKKELDEIRKRFAFLDDQDKFDLKGI